MSVAATTFAHMTYGATGSRSTLARPTSLAEQRWRQFRRALMEAVHELTAEPNSWFTIMTHPGRPALCEQVLTLRNSDGRLGIEHDGVRIAAGNPDELATTTLDVLNELGAIRPDEVNAAFPRRIRACSAPFFSDAHCPSGDPDTYDRELLRRHVQRAAIGWLGYAPHVDDDGDLVIYRGSAVVYVTCYADTPVVKIWSHVVADLGESGAAIEAVNGANNRQPFAKFMVRDGGVYAWTLVDAWEFSALNFIRLLDHFLETIDQESEALRLELRLGSRS